MERGFEEASGIDLRQFFDQWFFRAGFPILTTAHAPSADGIVVNITQVQDEDAYELATTIAVECEDGSSYSFDIDLVEKESRFEWPLPSPARTVTLDAEGVLPARIDG